MLTLDALPPRLLLNVFYSSGPWVINLFNMSPSSGVFLTTFKHAVQDLPNHVAGCAVDDSAGGGLSTAGDRSLSPTGLTLEMWNIGWILNAAGSFKRTAATFTIGSTTYGSTNRGASFLDSTSSRRSLVESQTLCPGW